jgi:menaquinone-dependent protoporphyrinogen oxidase
VPGKVLIAYASKYGSTVEVAEAIAKTFEDEGVEADLRDARSVGDLRGYRAVVFGAPLYNARMLRAGRRFLARHQRELAGMPVAVFALGPLGTSEKEIATTQKQFDRSLAHRSEIKPVSTALFGGVIDQSKLRFPDKLAPPLRPLFPFTDVRDWDAIEAWAAALADALSPENQN